jgi:Antibiotic biosynthesis monooxygenase
MNSQPQASGTSLRAAGLGTSASVLPDIDRPGVQVALVRQIPVDRPDLQRPIADATLAAWDASLWPEGVLSRTCYLSTDGQRVLTYEQRMDDNTEMVDHGAIAYRLYRSGTRDDAAVPGCIVIVDVQTDGHDTARRWVDTVFEALAAETTLHSGGISGHFHISADGTRVMNYAEWTDEQSHIEALSGTGSIGRGPAWQRVQTMPGVINLGVRRYTGYGFRERSNLPRSDV